MTAFQLISILLSVIGFFCALAAGALLRMARDINEIKVTVMRVDTKHDGLEKRVDRLEKQLEKNEV